MNSYEHQALMEMRTWQRKMKKGPSILNRLSKRVQTKVNSYIPEKVHKAITTAIRQMIKAVSFGAGYITRSPSTGRTFQQTEDEVKLLIDKYKQTAAVEGGLTGAGGFLLGLAEFPILLSIKLKMLFDIASLYGFDVMDYRERLYILHVFELAFSSQEHRQKVYRQIEAWDEKKNSLPTDINQFNWRAFQQEYRDYIDLAKMAQLIPGIGAVVGVVVNHRLITQLGTTAMNSYRMRILDKPGVNALLPSP